MEIQEKRKKQFIEIADEMLSLFLKKNQDYGDDYFSGSYSDIERWMSIKRKVARLENFYKTGTLNSVSDETIQDTWKDLGIYCIMELMLRRKNENQNSR
jgi:hypothetical protein